MKEGGNHLPFLFIQSIQIKNNLREDIKMSKASTKKNQVEEKELTAIELTNLVISEAIAGVIAEALNHFTKTNRPRNYKNDDDNRYLYSKEELKAFFANYPKDDVYYREVTDDLGKFFCFELSRIPADTKFYKNRNVRFSIV